MRQRNIRNGLPAPKSWGGGSFCDRSSAALSFTGVVVVLAVVMVLVLVMLVGEEAGSETVVVTPVEPFTVSWGGGELASKEEWVEAESAGGG